MAERRFLIWRHMPGNNSGVEINGIPWSQLEFLDFETESQII